MLHYDRIYLGEGMMPLKVITVKTCTVCFYWYFNYGFKFQKSVRNGCQDLLILCLKLAMYYL